MNKFTLRITAPVLAVVAILASAQGVSAMTNEYAFRSIASSVYGDAECGTILMTANPKYINASSAIYSSMLSKPNTTACLILSSYVRSSSMNLMSHEVVAVESAELTNPYQFESVTLPALQKANHDVVTSTTFSWLPVDPSDIDPNPITASSTWTLVSGKVVSVHSHGASATTTLEDGSVVNTYDAIDHVTNLKNSAGIVYRAQKGSDWYVVSSGTESAPWALVDQLTVDESTSSTIVLYRAMSEDGSWHIVKNDTVYDLSWKPMNVALNSVTFEPFAGDQTGRMWTPSKEWKYPNSARVQGIDSKGRLLVTTLSYPDMDLKELWVNDKQTAIFIIANQYHEAAPSFTNERAVSVYFPGYVQTFDANISFNAKDEIVIYRQEGRVFTRSVYQVK
jgi:hypothetical protein